MFQYEVFYKNFGPTQRENNPEPERAPCILDDFNIYNITQTSVTINWPDIQISADTIVRNIEIKVFDDSNPPNQVYSATTSNSAYYQKGLTIKANFSIGTKYSVTLKANCILSNGDPPSPSITKYFEQ